MAKLGSRIAPLLLAASLLLAACGSNGEDEGGAAGKPTKEPPAKGTGTEVTATLNEYTIKLSTNRFEPGPYTFEVKEAGAAQAPHALTIKGPGVGTATSKVLNPGDPPEPLDVTLQKGTYELWCPVGNHRDEGMETTITVR